MNLLYKYSKKFDKVLSRLKECQKRDINLFYKTIDELFSIHYCIRFYKKHNDVDIDVFPVIDEYVTKKLKCDKTFLFTFWNNIDYHIKFLLYLAYLNNFKINSIMLMVRRLFFLMGSMTHRKFHYKLQALYHDFKIPYQYMSHSLSICSELNFYYMKCFHDVIKFMSVDNIILNKISLNKEQIKDEFVKFILSKKMSKEEQSIMTNFIDKHPDTFIYFLTRTVLKKRKNFGFDIVLNSEKFLSEKNEFKKKYFYDEKYRNIIHKKYMDRSNYESYFRKKNYNDRYIKVKHELE